MTSVTRPRAVDYAQRPMLVFWEVTRACLLACAHCRASATPDALPGELGTEEGRRLIDQVAGFGRPYPILVLTGGDCLLRKDTFELVEYANSLGVPVAMSPSVTPMLTDEAIHTMVECGVKAVSLSLDGATAATHDGVRGIPGHFDQTIPAIRALVAAGLKVQINTTVMRANVDELADIAALMAQTGVHIWEVFFLVHVGRGEATGAITPQEHEDVCHFLYDASHYGYIVRTVEAPFFRRVVVQRREGLPAPADELYVRLHEQLVAHLGPERGRSSAHTASTRDGKGIVFVAYNGEVYPAGFLPLGLGSVREQPLADIYRDNPTLLRIRSMEFGGRCGVCEYADLCGGSRARAYAATGDPLAEDPACPYVPQVALTRG
ncbi:MAG: TIGR04053 family radical SAM/SPASM domain-containing protein [Candidatus Nanopelagicales bacterium]|jgi:radical SAM protein|nr:TIGR04053 family radical SAM/SPASM domain-containing protein [Actinomycetota bacterium]HNL50808.1 TIGR04053 family radical SAM/SPASM domain-containing protein [Actinomycetota bacterium]HNO15333.1 TIGR04053 family radical SAM/SPASM domain-containing protein [Actinomycetota bacterium]HUM86187.1 TIGR04053 family radical SAM/SPASM domain-containing protein [Actinomycetota bacterium]